MTAAFLQSELASLIQDSKRKQSDVRTAAEKSLADLKAIQVTSETQLAGDLLRRPHFIEPFILACNSKYVKLAVAGATCLQRLIASKAVPPTRLADILGAFQEAAQQGLDVQLKVLQALPSLLQLYTSELHGDALGKILSLCAGLAASKTALVSSTATATFQQVITGLFEKQAPGKTYDDEGNEEPDDAIHVFIDMCTVVSGDQPQFLRPQGLTLTLALQVIELSLTSSKFEILDVSECSAACNALLIPGMVDVLSKTTNFSAFGRSLRVLYLLISRQLTRMLGSLSETFDIILSIMDRPSGPAWRRILCLELMKNIMLDHQLFRTIYTIFDNNHDRNSVVGPLMAILVRVAAEDPALIGLGRQSTIPTNSEDTNGTGGLQVDVDDMGSVLQASSNVTGISSRWSTPNKPLLEQVDGQTSPDMPETYVYTLALGCVASLSDGLSKYIMPLSVPSRESLESIDNGDIDGTPTRKNSQSRRSEKYQRLLNPLKREDLTSKDDVQICAKLIEDCWPAVLATCSTFLNSALDSYFYHMLVRTVQKLAQVSGVLELLTPRDALLTTLAKVSVPINASSFVTAVHGMRLAKVTKDDENSDADEASIKSPIMNTPRLSVDVSRQPLNVRNLLCLRALLNLGIALGPTLNESSWFIIIQALQQADALMSVSPSTRTTGSKSQSYEEPSAEGQTNLGTEITAVGTASKRMMESTRSYPDETLQILLRSVFRMVENLVSDADQKTNKNDANNNPGLKVAPSRHQARRSVSGALSLGPVLHIEAEFVLKTINDLARINLHRFCSSGSKPSTWDFVGTRLLSIVADNEVSPQLRLQAASILNAISIETMRMLETIGQANEDFGEMQNLCLSMLDKQISQLYQENTSSIITTDVDIHRRLLEALENIVSNAGDSLTSGWRTVFVILQKTMKQTSTAVDVPINQAQEGDQETILERTVPPAFRTIQLIVSDFLTTIDPHSFSILVQLLTMFGVQKNELNISLTTTVLFSNLSSLLLERSDLIDVQISSTNTSSKGNAENFPALERKPTDVSSLWFAVVLQLCILCQDERSDVRNSALRVLVRILDSSSSQLTSNTWNACLQEGLLPLLARYSSSQLDTAVWHTSFTQLLQGVVALFTSNAGVITVSSAFAATWTQLIAALNSKLSEQRLEGHTVVFLSAAELLRTLHFTQVQGKEVVFPVLQFWLENHPANIPVEDQSSQDALTAHAQLFKTIMENSSNDIQDFSENGQPLADLVMAATKQAAFASIHPPYSTDISKPGAEQIAISENLAIIRQMMSARKPEYATFLLDLVGCILTRNIATEIEGQKVGVGKNLKRPTLIALMSQCINLFRAIILDELSSIDILSNTSAITALSILTKVVSTKYSKIPSSNDSPTWQNATCAITELVEAAQYHVTHISSEDIRALASPIVAALESILNAPALEDKQPPLALEVVTADEAFDVEQFGRFHKASVSLLGTQDFPQEQRNQYIINIFHASLIAKPWFDDLPPDLQNDPLAKLKEIRPGSIRQPDFLPRDRIPYEAFNTLLDLVNDKTNSDTKLDNLTIATTAAPYLILRIAHSIKVFLADQRLRNLIPPPKPLQHELNVLLNKAVDLRVAEQGFTHLLSNTAMAGDGLTHLRILYPLVLQLKEFWARLPRLRVCAWQDGVDGRGIVTALERWGGTLAERWEIG